MVFVAPQDPRFQSLSQIGSNFGQGLGDALVQYIENKRFNQALGGLKPDSPVKDVLGAFAQNNVSQEQQQRYFSSAVQQALQRERGQEALGRLGKEDLSKLTPLQAVIKAMELTQNAPPGTLEAFLPAFTQAQQTERFQNIYGNGRSGTLGQKPMQPSTEQRGESAEGYSPAYNAPQQFEQPLQASQQAAITAPFIRSRVGGPTGPQGSRGFQRNLTLEDSIRNAFARGAQTKDQALFEAQLEQDTQRQQKEQEEADEENFKNRFNSKFQGKIDPWFEKFGIEDFRYQTGTDNERGEKAIQNVQNIKSGLNGLEKGNIRNFWNQLFRGDENQFYDKVGNNIKNVFSKAEVPEAMKPGLIDLTRMSLAKRGDMKDVGIAESMQRAVNPEFKKEMAQLKKVPSLPNLNVPTQLRVPTLKQYDKKLNESQPDVVNYLMKTLSNPWSSPLTIKARLLEKNYPDEWIGQRFAEAMELGWRPSSYQGSEVDLMNIPTYESIETILGGQPSLIGIPSQVGGVR